MMPFIPLMKEFEMKEHAVKRHLVRRAFLVARASFLKNNEHLKYTPLITIDITPLTESDNIAVSVYDERAHCAAPSPFVPATLDITAMRPLLPFAL